jgi:hypothetical protein
MSDVYSRVTQEFRKSQSWPDYDPVEWIEHPDMSGVVGVPQKYRRLVDDVPTAMDRTKRDAVDAAEATARETQQKSDAKSLLVGDESQDRFNRGIVRRLAQLAGNTQQEETDAINSEIDGETR